MTLNMNEGLEWFRVCASRGFDTKAIEETDTYTVYRVESTREVLEFHFNHSDDYVLVFREKKEDTK